MCHLVVAGTLQDLWQQHVVSFGVAGTLQDLWQQHFVSFVGSWHITRFMAATFCDHRLRVVQSQKSSLGPSPLIYKYIYSVRNK